MLFLPSITHFGRAMPIETSCRPSGCPKSSQLRRMVSSVKLAMMLVGSRLATTLTYDIRFVRLGNVHETVGDVLYCLIDGCFNFVGMTENHEFVRFMHNKESDAYYNRDNFLKCDLISFSVAPCII
jgi:hypothetical protein